MAKTMKELKQIKQEYETLASKLKELSEDELKQVTGGTHCFVYVGSKQMIHDPAFGEASNNGEIKPPSTKAWFSTPD